MCKLKSEGGRCNGYYRTKYHLTRNKATSRHQDFAQALAKKDDEGIKKFLASYSRDYEREGFWANQYIDHFHSKTPSSTRSWGRYGAELRELCDAARKTNRFHDILPIIEDAGAKYESHYSPQPGTVAYIGSSRNKEAVTKALSHLPSTWYENTPIRFVSTHGLRFHFAPREKYTMKISQPEVKQGGETFEAETEQDAREQFTRFHEEWVPALRNNGDGTWTVESMTHIQPNGKPYKETITKTQYADTIYCAPDHEGAMIHEATHFVSFNRAHLRSLQMAYFQKQTAGRTARQLECGKMGYPGVFDDDYASVDHGGEVLSNTYERIFTGQDVNSQTRHFAYGCLLV